MGGGSNGSPFCGRTAAIVYQGKTIHGTLTDKCPGCVSLLLPLRSFRLVLDSDEDI